MSCPSESFNQQTGQWSDTGEDSVLADADYYEMRCCHSPEGSLPNCQVRWEKNNGGSSFDPDTLAEYQRRYGGKLRLIAVAPDDGDCGYIKTTINDTQQQCCVGVTPLVVDNENSVEVIADNSSAVIVVTGGKLPLTISVRGQGFFLDNNGSRDGVVNSQSFSIYTTEACGTCLLTISDGCSSTTHIVRSTNGQWVTVYSNNNGGVLGFKSDGIDIEPYPGGCPFTASSTSLGVGKTIIQGRYSIRHLYAEVGSGFRGFYSLDDATSACEAEPNPAFYEYRYKESAGCFYEEGPGYVGSQCDAPLFVWPDQSPPWQSADIGHHTTIMDTTSGQWWLYTRWVGVISTEIKEWVC